METLLKRTFYTNYNSFSATILDSINQFLREAKSKEITGCYFFRTVNVSVTASHLERIWPEPLKVLAQIHISNPSQCPVVKQAMDKFFQIGVKTGPFLGQMWIRRV